MKLTLRLAWTVLAVLSAYAVFIGGAWWGLYQPTIRLMTLLFAAIVLVVWGYKAWRDPAWRPRSVLLPAILACLASLGLSTLFSRVPAISVEYLAYAVLLAALYLLLVRLLAEPFFRRRFVGLAGGLFIAIVVGYLGLTVSHWARWLAVLGTLTMPPLRPEFESLMFGNPSTVLTMVALLAVPLVARASWTTRRGVATVVAVLGLTAAVALVSGSRAGWLAIAIAVGAAPVFLLAYAPGRAGIRAVVAAQTGAARAALVVSVLVIGGVAIAVAPAVARRVSEGGEGNRLTFVRVALELFAEAPIVGTGPGTWVIERPGLTRPDEIDEYIPHAHNVYAQTLGELGLVGAIAGLILVALLARLVLGAIRGPDEQRRRWGWATLLGLVYFAAHQLLDFYPNFPAVLFAAAIPVAFLDATNPEAARSRWLPTRLDGKALGVAAAVLAVAVVGLAAQELPAMASNTAVDLANRGAWAEADDPARDAAAQDPRVSAYLFTAGLTAAHAGNHEGAKDYFRAVTNRDDVPEAWLNLAAEQAELGDQTAAGASLRSALRIGRQRPAVSIPAGDLALRIGDRELAVEAFTAAVLRSPSFLGDPWWQAEPARRSLQREVVSNAMTLAPSHVRWELALMAGDVSRARELAADPALDPSTIDFVDAWAGDDGARTRLHERCAATSNQLTPLFWCARIEGRRGNVDAANDYRYLASAQIGNAYRNGAELRVATNPMIGRGLEGDPAIFWGTYTYRRFTPWDVLVPSLVHLTLA